MENILQSNKRILIGQELGEIYLIIQEYINNKWQSQPKHNYRGNYFVMKKIKELLKYDINDICTGNKRECKKFCVNTYFPIRNY